MSNDFPSLQDPGISNTRDAIHAYSKILGDWLKTCRPKRKHWWHASLRPSLLGLTTGIIHAEVSFELELDLWNNALRCRTVSNRVKVPLNGRPPEELSQEIKRFLASEGVDQDLAPKSDYSTEAFRGYASDHARRLAQVPSPIIRF